MEMLFEEHVGGLAALRALQAYCKRLDEKYGKKGFLRFRAADMGVLSEA